MRVKSKETIYCDVCGKEIPPSRFPTIIEKKTTVKIFHAEIGSEDKIFDFHRNCLE